MPDNPIQDIVLPHLRTQFGKARGILFTGAGFSREAKNILGEPLPSVLEVRQRLWSLAFGDEAFDETASLQDIYHAARLRNYRQVKQSLTDWLTVEASSLPEWYYTFFQVPWKRCYTLNIDDLEAAANRMFNLPRKPISISGANQDQAIGLSTRTSKELEFIHLNGGLSDIPDQITFSVTEYAARARQYDPYYVLLTADLVTNPVVFVGTTLDEPPLWQHIQLRHQKGPRGTRELRPRSYLVTPRVDAAKRALLAEYNIFWLKMTAEEFAMQILDPLREASRNGLVMLTDQLSNSLRKPTLADVADLAVNPHEKSDFLIGQEPIWADLQSGRAITRSCDEKLWHGVTQACNRNGLRGLVLVTGTAGSGKSTALMKVCLRLSAEGKRVGWLDRDSELSPRELQRIMRASNPPQVVGLDDADIFGSEFAPMVREISASPPYPVILAAVRASKVDGLLGPQLDGTVPMSEFSMPHLADSDISALLDVLAKENRLGALRGQSRDDQLNVFRDKAGRQLLVAMIEATSGYRFEEKVLGELNDLGNLGARIYALIAVSSSFRFGLMKDEVFIALDDHSNEALNTIELLLNRHILKVGKGDTIWTRHRRIGEIITDSLLKTGQITTVVLGLAQFAATKVTPGMRSNERPRRLLRSIINHDFLIRGIGLEAARNLYGELEHMLHWDYHYWLQRGSLEVEKGDLYLAQNFLSQAKGLSPDDPYVLNEYAYLLFAKALANPKGEVSQKLVEDAIVLLEGLIDRNYRGTEYPYHVLGSQGLAWSRRAVLESREREKFLKYLVDVVTKGCQRFPRSRELQTLFKELKREYLGIAVV